MPRTFALSAQYRVDVARVYAAFASERYWLARLADSGADTARLDFIAVDTATGIDVATTQAIDRQRLPALAAQFHAGNLEVVRSEKWGPLRAGQARAQISGRILRAPAALVGSAVLAPADTGCSLRFTATVQVDIPLVGGKIETFIGSQLADLVSAEQRFTSTWLAGEQ